LGRRYVCITFIFIDLNDWFVFIHCLIVYSDEEVGRSASDLALNCRQVAEDLRDTAYKKGSFDNISVMIIRSVR